MKTLLLSLSFLMSLSTVFGQAAKRKLNITHLTGDFYVYTTFNTFKGTPFPANALYVVTDAGVIMVDTPWDTTQFQPLLDSIKIRHNKEVVMCIATHSHEDRTIGLDFLKQKGIRTYTTKQTDIISRKRGEKRAQFLFAKDTIFTVGQHSFQTYYGGPGHTPDNIVIWFDKAKILYGGCLIKSIEADNLGNMADADVKKWASTLMNIQVKFRHPDFIITGHQTWTSLNSLIHTLKLVRQAEEKTQR